MIISSSETLFISYLITCPIVTKLAKKEHDIFFYKQSDMLYGFGGGRCPMEFPSSCVCFFPTVQCQIVTPSPAHTATARTSIKTVWSNIALPSMREMHVKWWENNFKLIQWAALSNRNPLFGYNCGWWCSCKCFIILRICVGLPHLCLDALGGP